MHIRKITYLPKKCKLHHISQNIAYIQFQNVQNLRQIYKQYKKISKNQSLTNITMVSVLIRLIIISQKMISPPKMITVDIVIQLITLLSATISALFPPLPLPLPSSQNAQKSYGRYGHCRPFSRRCLFSTPKT